ncbi:MFS transporter [Paenibacillus sp. PL2-23]|uniref:MFS transporter n=1 Tax=Paenibacillus sp. PL2-23 TaxID=2100729 RepID=UPI0030F659D9
MVHRRVLLLFTICSFLVGLDALIISPLIPEISESIGFPVHSGGLLITFYALFYGLSAPIFGPISDGWGRKRMIIMGLFLFSVGTTLTVFGQSLWQLLLYRSIAGIGGAMVMPSVFAWVGDVVHTEHRGRVMGRITGAMGAANMFGIPIGALLTHYSSWKWTFVLVGAAAAALAWAAYKLLEENPAEGAAFSKKVVLHSYYQAFSHRLSMMALMCTFFWWAAFQGLFANMGTLYASRFMLSTAALGLIFSIAGLGNWLGNRMGGRLSDRMGRKVVIGIASFGSAAFIMAIPLVHSWVIAVVVLQFLWAFTTGLGQSSLTTYIAELNPRVRGTLMALNSSVTYLGMTISTAVAAGILQYGGFAYVGLLCSLSALIVPVILRTLKPEAGGVQ